MNEITPRLWWDGSRGIARIDGVSVELRKAPDVIPHLRTIDYAPSLRTFLIRESAQACREMFPEEIQAAANLLARVSSAAQAALA